MTFHHLANPPRRAGLPPGRQAKRFPPACVPSSKDGVGRFALRKVGGRGVPAGPPPQSEGRGRLTTAIAALAGLLMGHALDILFDRLYTDAPLGGPAYRCPHCRAPLRPIYLLPILR